MAKQTQNITQLRQFERTYKDDDCTMVWKYDLDKFANGPVSVDIKWTSEYLKQNKAPNKPKADGKLGELHDAFAKLDSKKKKKKPQKPKDTKGYW